MNIVRAIVLSASGLLAAGCGSSPAAPSDSFSGKYTSCFLFQGGEAGGASGYLGDASLTVARNGSGLAATFGHGGSTSTLDFTTIAETAATLAPTPQHLSSGVGCVTGPLAFASATLSPTSGTLTSDSNAVFLSVVGPVADTDGGAPCAKAVGVTAGTVSILCEKAGTSASKPGSAASAPPPSFPTGTFACEALVASHSPSEQALTSGSGTLTLSQAGAKVTAAFSNSVAYPSGTLQFVVTSATSANPVPGTQTLLASCAAASSTGTVEMTSGSLTMNGETLVLAFAGAFGATCQGAVVGGSLTCTKQP